MASNDTGVRTTTLSDVARLAGVSLATASKAMNGRTDVAPATRRRVLEAAEDLAFTPNAMARGLLAGRTGTVGLLTSDLDGRFMLPILMGAEDAFGAGQVNVFLCDARGDAIREQHHLRALLSRRVDGIIVVGRQTDPRPSLGQDIPVPVVYAYAPSDDDRDLSLTPDNRAGGRLAVEHLLACGRTRIAHISGDPTYAAARERLDGARSALADAGLEFVGEPLSGDWSEHWAASSSGAASRRRSRPQPVDASSPMTASASAVLIRIPAGSASTSSASRSRAIGPSTGDGMPRPPSSGATLRSTRCSRHPIRSRGASSIRRAISGAPFPTTSP